MRSLAAAMLTAALAVAPLGAAASVALADDAAAQAPAPVATEPIEPSPSPEEISPSDTADAGATPVAEQTVPGEPGTPSPTLATAPAEEVTGDAEAQGPEAGDQPQHPADADAPASPEQASPPASADDAAEPAPANRAAADETPSAPADPPVEASAAPDGATDDVETGIAPGAVRTVTIDVVEATMIQAVVAAPLGVEIRLTGDVTSSGSYSGALLTRKVSNAGFGTPFTGQYFLQIRNGTDRTVEAAVETSFVRAGGVRLEPRVSLNADRLTVTTTVTGPFGPITGQTLSARITADNGIWHTFGFTEIETGVYEMSTGVMRSGDYTVRVRMTLDDREYAAVAVGRIVGTDTNGPEVTIGTEPATPNIAGWYTGDLDVLIEADDPQGVFAVWHRIGDGPSEVTAGSARIPIVDDGEHLITAWAWDRIFNISEPVTRTVRVDRSPAEISLAGALERGHAATGSNAPAEFSCTDPHSGVDTCVLRLAGGPNLFPGDPLPTGIAGELSYTITAWNGAALSTQRSGVLRISDDTTPPVIVVTTEPAASNARGWFARTVTASIVASDPGSDVDWVEHRVDGGAWQRTAGNRVDVVVENDGETLIDYRAADVAGNVTGDRTRLIRVDRTAPQVTIDPAIDGAVVAPGDPLIADFTCADATSGVRDCIGSTEAGAALPTDEVGTFELSVSATDNAGNLTVERAEYEVREQLLGATAAVSTPANDHGWWNAPVTVEIVGSPGADTVHWELEGAQTGSGEAAGRTTVTIEAEGSTRLYYRASNSSGSSEPVRLDIQMDRTAPEILHWFEARPEFHAGTPAVDAMPSDLRFELGEHVDFTWGCSDELSDVIECESDLPGEVLPTDAVGSRTFSFRALDAAGNERVENLVYAVFDPTAGGEDPGPGGESGPGGQPGPGGDPQPDGGLAPVGSQPTANGIGGFPLAARGGTADRLPATGADPVPGILAAALLLILGAGAIALTRRRES